LIKLTIEKPAKITEFKYGIQIETKKQNCKPENKNRNRKQNRKWREE
jgi:hypothetical protein